MYSSAVVVRTLEPLQNNTHFTSFHILAKKISFLLASTIVLNIKKISNLVIVGNLKRFNPFIRIVSI